MERRTYLYCTYSWYVHKRIWLELEKIGNEMVQPEDQTERYCNAILLCLIKVYCTLNLRNVHKTDTKCCLYIETICIYIFFTSIFTSEPLSEYFDFVILNSCTYLYSIHRFAIFTSFSYVYLKAFLYKGIHVLSYSTELFTKSYYYIRHNLLPIYVFQTFTSYTDAHTL